MKQAGLSAIALMIAVVSVQAQNPAPPPRAMGDSAPLYAPMRQPGMRPGPGGMQGDPERMQMLREQIERRFGEMVQNQLNLTESQMQQLRTAMRANQDRKRDLMRRQQDIQRAIGRQMEPGVAANADSLNRLLNAGGQVHVDMAQSDNQFMRDLTFLTPVQRARLLMMTRRFEERVQDIRRGQLMGPDDRRPEAGDRRPGDDRGPGMQGQRRQPVPRRPE